MNKPVILEGNPFVSDSHKKDATTLLADTGGNTGNLAFRYAVNDQLKGARQMSWGSGVKAIREAGDVIVLPLANQLGKHTDLGSQADLLEEIGLPVVGIGLGAQADEIGQDIQLSEGTMRWLSVLAKLAPSDAPNLGVRGAYTASQIEKLGFSGRAIVTGCPSNFINPNKSHVLAIEKRYAERGGKIAVTAGIPHIPRLAELERELADIVTLTQGAYIVQHGLEMVQIARGEFNNMSAQTFELTRNYVQPFMSDEQFKAWCRDYAYAIFDARYWMDFVQRFDFIVGTRFHGVMLALQAGVPAGCIAHDSRTLEMCNTMGVPVVHAKDLPAGINRYNIRSIFQFSPEEYWRSKVNLANNYSLIVSGAKLETRPLISP